MRYGRVLGGARPTGGLHIGHYAGMIKPFLHMLDDADEAIFMIADIHMLTTNATPASVEQIRQRRRRLVAECVGAGIDPERTSFCLQSEIIEQAQVYTIVQCLLPWNMLTEQPSYQAMAKALPNEPSLGLLGYPVLEAADIIGLGITHVAVGEHDVEHVMAGQEIAERLTTEWGLEVPRPMPVCGGANLLGLDGYEKMSKSLGNTVQLGASPDEVAAAVERMVVWGADDRCVPAEVLAVVGSPEDARAMAEGLRSGSLSPDEARAAVLEAVEVFLAPIRRQIRLASAEAGRLDELLVKGTERARIHFREGLSRLRGAVGFGLAL